MSTAEPPDEPSPTDQVPAPPAPRDAPVEPAVDVPAGAPVDAPIEPTTEVPASTATWSALTTPGAVPPPAPDLMPAPSDAWSAPAPAPKRKLTWLWVLLGVLGLIAVLVVVAVVLFVRTLAGPIDATNQVLAPIKSENYPAAYRLACSENRTDYDESAYAQVFIDTTDQRGKITGYDVNYSSVHGSTADVRYDISFKGGSTLRLEARAVKENGKWRACLLPNKPGAVSP